MALVRLENVTKIFPGSKTNGPIRALDQVSLTVRDGQTLAIVGPSGAGKSTLLHVVAGREPINGGDLFFDNRKMNAVKAKDRYLSMVFRDYARYPHFKGRGKLDFLLGKHDAPDKETEERVRITAEALGFGVQELLKRKPGKLSGPRQQRLAIGRAIVRNPQLFLFDEPLSSLDARDRAQTRLEIKRLLNRFRITALFVTHDQTEAMAVGNQIAVMNAGRIEHTGTVLDVYHRPANTFVAGFWGLPPMNLLTGGTVAEASVRLDQMTIPLPEAVRSHVHTGQAITLGIRPEEIRLVLDDHPQPNGFRMRGTVEAVEPDFARNIQLVRLRTGRLTYTVRAKLTKLVQPGDEPEVIFPFEQMCLFDGASEQRIG